MMGFHSIFSLYFLCCRRVCTTWLLTLLVWCLIDVVCSILLPSLTVELLALFLRMLRISFDTTAFLGCRTTCFVSPDAPDLIWWFDPCLQIITCLLIISVDQFLEADNTPLYLLPLLLWLLYSSRPFVWCSVISSASVAVITVVLLHALTAFLCRTSTAFLCRTSME